MSREEATDYSPYLWGLVRNWYWIIGAALLFAVISLLLTGRDPGRYQTTAAVIAGGTNAQQLALLTLATSDDVARRALEEARAGLTEEQQALLPQVSGDGRSNLNQIVRARRTGELIELTITANDPEVAAALANAWIAVFIDYANNLNLGNNNTATVETVTAQLELAEQHYYDTQAELEQFIGDNQIAALQNEIDLVTIALDEREQAVEEYYENLHAIELLLIKAESLREQIMRSDGAALMEQEIALAYMLLRLQLDSISKPVVIDLDGQDFTPATEFDVDRLVELITWRQAAIEEQIGAVLTDAGAAAPAKYEHLMMLEEELARQESRNEELIQARDQALRTYVRFQGDLAALEYEQASSVRLASSAVAPRAPLSNNQVQNTVLAGIFGGMVAVGLLFSGIWWRQYRRG